MHAWKAVAWNQRFSMVGRGLKIMPRVGQWAGRWKITGLRHGLGNGLIAQSRLSLPMGIKTGKGQNQLKKHGLDFDLDFLIKVCSDCRMNSVGLQRCEFMTTERAQFLESNSAGPKSLSTPIATGHVYVLGGVYMAAIPPAC